METWNSLSISSMGPAYWVDKTFLRQNMYVSSCLIGALSKSYDMDIKQNATLLKAELFHLKL